MRLLLVAMTARRRRGLALAALLAPSCQRSLTPVVPPSSQQGSGGSRASGTGGNSGSTSPGTGGSAGPGGGAGAIDAGADRVTPPVDAARDAGGDRTADVSRPPDALGCPVDCNHLPHMRKMFEDPSMGAAALSISSAGSAFIVGGTNDGTTTSIPVQPSIRSSRSSGTYPTSHASPSDENAP
jgi:hypothetical protein